MADDRVGGTYAGAVGLEETTVQEEYLKGGGVDAMDTLETDSSSNASVQPSRTSAHASQGSSSVGRGPMSGWDLLANTLKVSARSKTKILSKCRELAMRDYEKKIEEALNSEMTDQQREDTFEEAEDAAYLFLEDALECLNDPAIGATEAQLLTDMMKRCKEELIESKEKEDQKAAQDIEESGDKLAGLYEAKIKRVLAKGDTSREEVDHVNDDLRKEFLKDFEDIVGYKRGFNVEILKTRIDQIYEDLWGKQTAEFEEKVQGIVLKAKEIYRKGMMNRVKVDAGSLDDVHQDIVKQLENWIQNDGQYDEDVKFAALERLSNGAQAAKEKCASDLKERRQQVEKAVGKYLEDELRNYEVAMIQHLENRAAPLPENDLRRLHETVKKGVINDLKTELQKLLECMQKKEARQALAIKELDDQCETKLQQLKVKNAERLPQMIAQVKTALETLRDGFLEAIERAVEECDDEEDYQGRAGDLRAVFTLNANDQVPEGFQNLDDVQAAMTDLQRYFEREIKANRKALRFRMKEDDIVLESCMAVARRRYREDMDKVVANQRWFEPRELLTKHEEILTRVLRLAGESVTMNSAQERRLKDGLGIVFRDYEEINLCKTPGKQPVIGIDLGTTYSCVGVLVDGKVEIIANQDDGKKTTASFVAFTETREIVVGNEAKKLSATDPKNTVFDAKRLIGRKYSDESVRQDRLLWPFDVVRADDDQARIRVRGVSYRAEEISARVIAKMKAIAETHLDRRVTQAVITVPAYFGNDQKQATKHAAAIAGLDAKIITEPVAAAIAFKIHRTGDARRTVLVFDLGGGTFDVAIVRVRKGDIDVLAVKGDTHLGGEDFDNAMVKTLIQRVIEKHGIDLGRDRNSLDEDKRTRASCRLRRLKSKCEDEKCTLSFVQRVRINIEGLDGEFNLDEEFTREEFNEINAPLFDKCIDIVGQALTVAKVSKEEIDDVVLVGGSTRIPRVQELVKDFFDGKELNRQINADEAVAYGAAFQAPLIHDRVEGGGAGMQLRDVTPLPIGVRVEPGYMNVVVPSNTRIPCSIGTGPIYTTTTPNQTECIVEIYEGEHELVANNNFLGRFRLQGIPPAPAMQELIEVTMNITEEGLLQVEAKTVTNEVTSSLDIIAYTGRMTQEEVNIAQVRDLMTW